MQKVFCLGLLSLFVGCASAPMTQEECIALGGDTTVDFHDRGVVCCKIAKINSDPYCEEVKRERPVHEPREPKAGRE